MEQKPIFVTLGPTGTNHEFVTQRFIDFHSINARLELIGDFFEGLEIISRGHADYLVQAAVHPDCADVVAKGHFEYDIHVIDTFISSSKILTILTHSDIPIQRTIDLQKAICEYTDISVWPEHVFVKSVMLVADGLLQGNYDSGLTTLDVVEKNSGGFRIDNLIDSGCPMASTWKS